MPSKKHKEVKTLQIPYNLYDVTCILYQILEDYLKYDRTHAECYQVFHRVSWCLKSTKHATRICIDEEFEKLRSHETTRADLKETIAVATDCLFAMRSADESRQRNWGLDDQTECFIAYMDTCTPWNDGIELVVFQELHDIQKHQKTVFDKEEAKKLKKLLGKQPKEVLDEQD